MPENRGNLSKSKKLPRFKRRERRNPSLWSLEINWILFPPPNGNFGEMLRFRIRILLYCTTRVTRKSNVTRTTGISGKKQDVKNVQYCTRLAGGRKYIQYMLVQYRYTSYVCIVQTVAATSVDLVKIEILEWLWNSYLPSSVLKDCLSIRKNDMVSWLASLGTQLLYW